VTVARPIPQAGEVETVIVGPFGGCGARPLHSPINGYVNI
jgi:hypothetical protein